MSVDAGELRRRNLRTLAALAALFLLPLFGAFWLYYATDWRPPRHINHGVLISPVRPLPAVQLPRLLDAAHPGTEAVPRRGKWALVYVGDGGCPVECQRALYVMRQARLALNNDMGRVERVFLVRGGCCATEFLAREHPGLIVLDASGPPGTELLRSFAGGDAASSVFIIDPLGNLMMRYDATLDPKGLLLDLQKLLRLSHIG